MRLMPIEFVKPNTVLGKTIYDVDGRILLKDGVILSERTIQKIKEINILSIYISDQYSNEEVDDIIKPELRQKAISTIKDAFSNIEKANAGKCDEAEFSAKDQGYFNNIDRVAEELIDDLLSNKKLLSLVDIRSMNNYIYSHSVNVAVISLVIGRALKFDRRKLSSLCMGALIHDVGKTLIPKEIITKNTELTTEETELLNYHTRFGYKLLSDAHNVNSVSKMIVLQHHERPDGNGYPDALSNDKISELSKIVSVADTFDRLSTDRPNQRAMFPSDVVEYLMANAGKMFDYDIVNIFCRMVIPFPKGTLVKLSTEEIAIVEETVENYPLRPIVKILESSDISRINLEINLVEEIAIVIKSIVYNM